MKPVAKAGQALPGELSEIFDPIERPCRVLPERLEDSADVVLNRLDSPVSECRGDPTDDLPILV